MSLKGHVSSKPACPHRNQNHHLYICIKFAKIEIIAPVPPAMSRRSSRNLGSLQEATDRFKKLIAVTTKNTTPERTLPTHTTSTQTPLTPQPTPWGTDNDPATDKITNLTTVAAFLREHKAPEPADALAHLSQLMESCAHYTSCQPKAIKGPSKPVHESTCRSPGSELVRSVFPRITRHKYPFPTCHP
jgi:hypothetical protein